MKCSVSIVLQNTSNLACSITLFVKAWCWYDLLKHVGITLSCRCLVIYFCVICRLFTGPGIAPQSIPSECSNVVLILNGRSASKVSVARRWLDYIVQQSSRFSNVAVVLLGNEQCNNSWIMRYMVKSGGPVKAAFIVYDSPDVDNDLFYQWPLGVAMWVLT